MTTQKQRAWRKKFARMYGGKRKRKRSRSRASKPARRYKKRYPTMARRRRYGRRRRRSSGIGLGGLLSVKNIIGVVGGGAVAGPVGAAVGSYALGKKSLLGAGIAYFAYPYIAPMIGQVLGGIGGSAPGSQDW